MFLILKKHNANNIIYQPSICLSLSLSPSLSLSLSLQDEKFSAYPTTDVKLGTSGRWVGSRTGACVTAILV